ncbi:hypothetical protein [Murdochiella massiliensis]|uniref:hypothetical protein n=1 Tax=Murdochiella massiliensis TaxID=1673723 RepID=UPI000829AB58|nr:hypothetical protein [Murdochiella massiliensis]
MASGLTNEEKKRLSNERQNAVRNAWKEEKERVNNGQGTRDWTPSQQRELLQRGAVSGYEGHHMKSVSLYPEYAGDPSNIQFLSEDEHLNGAHQGSYHNATNGYYDPETQTMNDFEGSELGQIPVNDLTECYSDDQILSIEHVREAYVSDESVTTDTDGNSDGISSARDAYKAGQSGGAEDSEGTTNSSSEGHGISR